MKPQTAIEHTALPSSVSTACPACGCNVWRPFYSVAGVPAQSCRQMPDRETALAQPRGRLELALCLECGFVANTAFDASLLQYSTDYEETQGASATFNAYMRWLAGDWIERYGLRERRILEIGCGKGEFLALICSMGNNHGTGFDPVYVPGREGAHAGGRLEFRAELYGADHRSIPADFICCRHTLEHIAPVAEFITMLRRNLEGREHVVLGFEVPDLERILAHGAFWDLYYEHCSYFTMLSLENLFRRNGFEVLRLQRVYGDQYLIIEAAPDGRGGPDDRREELVGLADAVETFSSRVARDLRRWRRDIDSWRRRGRRIVLWGSGSKAVGFIATLGITDEIDAVVDINPLKHGKYMPGCAAPIVAPERLRREPPDVVIVMNPVYRDEIAHDLARLGIDAELRVLQ
ncbi:class I SAM-dependent methyltransferase [bacterium]|nr:class I SAM-dependent methyltransferase [bacterium]